MEGKALSHYKQKGGNEGAGETEVPLSHRCCHKGFHSLMVSFLKGRAL